MSVARPAKEIAADIAANVASATEAGVGKSSFLDHAVCRALPKPFGSATLITQPAVGRGLPGVTEAAWRTEIGRTTLPGAPVSKTRDNEQGARQQTALHRPISITQGSPAQAKGLRPNGHRRPPGRRPSCRNQPPST